MANNIDDMAKKAQLTLTPKMWAIYLFLFAIFVAGTIAFMNYKGNIELSKPGSDNTVGPVNPDVLCPKTMADMGKTCCKPIENEPMQAVVSMVYVSVKCGCPEGTQYLKMAPEGDGKLYKICDCKCS